MAAAVSSEGKLFITDTFQAQNDDHLVETL